MTDTIRSINDVLARQAAQRGDSPAFTFLPERGEAEPALTFAELDRRARALAAELLRHAGPGERAVLLFLPGLDFLVALLGCFAAGIIAVPLMLPRRAGARDYSLAVLADCAPTLALTSREVAAARSDVIERFQDTVRWITVDAGAQKTLPGVALPGRGPDDIALLQYTSGSTSAPKGVMVAHGNLLANLEMIRTGWGTTERSTTVGWVPLYHDMGLILQVMQPLFLGAHSVLMPPAAFMRRPLAWLRAVSAFRAELSPAPNFAYDLCVSRFQPELMADVDLSCLKLAVNGAEPVHADTLARFAETFAPYGFAPTAMYPAYGLAEATLTVSSGQPGLGPVARYVSRAALQEGRAAPACGPQDAQTLVACGRSLEGERIAIVDPERRCAVPADTVGEIWVSGANVTQGYWRNPEGTEATFQARIEGCDGAWLRTGDLGLLDQAGNLYVTGRIKDVIIIRGMNHYPQDIERTVENAHPGLRPHGGAAFAHADETGGERLVVVHEIDRVHRRDLELEDVVARIREAVALEHEIAVDDVTLIRPATLPKTTSGKVQRNLTRRLWMDGALDRA